MYERGEAGPRPNPKLLNPSLREGFVSTGRLDVGYVNGVPYGLCTVSDEFPRVTGMAMGGCPTPDKESEGE